MTVTSLTDEQHAAGLQAANDAIKAAVPGWEQSMIPASAVAQLVTDVGVAILNASSAAGQVVASDTETVNVADLENVPPALPGQPTAKEYMAATSPPANLPHVAAAAPAPQPAAPAAPEEEAADTSHEAQQETT